MAATGLLEDQLNATRQPLAVRAYDAGELTLAPGQRQHYERFRYE